MKITKSMRFLLVALAAAMVFSLFSCTDDVPNDVETTQSGTDEVTNETTAPDAGDETTAPDAGDETTAPDAGDETTAPDAGDETTAPDAGDETTAPDAGDETTAPDAGDETTAPDAGDETTSPDAGDETTAPDAGDETTEPECVHVWNEGVVTTDPTCEGKGIKTYTCANDATHTRTEEIDAIGHEWNEGVVTTNPTCEGKGIKTYTCENDATHTRTEEINAIGHKWDDGAVTAEPTCEGKGVKTYTCAHDATHTRTEEVDAIGHKWDEGVVTTDPTCTVDGVKTYTCANDESHTKTEAVPAAHTWVDATVDAPKTCSACGATEGGCLEIQQDNVFTAEDILAAYKANPTANFDGELVTEDGVTYFKATATKAVQGTLVLNSGDNTVSNVGKNFVVVYRNKTAAINRIQLGINSAGKTNNAGGATPFFGISITNNWTAVYFNTSNGVDLSKGAGYISVDIFDTDNNNNVKTQVGDVMEIALIAMVDSKDTAQNVVGEYCGSFMKFPYTVNVQGIKVNGTTIKDSAVIPALSAADKAIEMDFSSVAIGGTADNCIQFGGGWAVTRGGWDYYEYKIIAADGTEKTLTLTDAVDFPATSTTLASIKKTYEASYGADFAVGGNLFSYYKINLSGFEGMTVTVEVYGVSNFGASYKLANIKNVTVPKLDNVFTAAEFYAAHKITPNAAFTSQLLTDENGLTYFRATAAQAGVGKLVLNSGANTVPGVGKYFVLVYRNNTNNVRRFDLYINSAGKTDNTGGATPMYATSKTDEWKIIMFQTSHPVNLANGAGYIAVDIFNANGIAGDVFDIALFAAVADEAAAWEVVKEYIGENLKFPYVTNVAGVVVNGTTYSDSTVLPNGNKGTNAPIEVDLSSVNISANSNLTNCLKLGSGWAVTRGGWDYYLCKITTEEGKTKTIRISEGADFGTSSGTLATLKSQYESSYGAELAVGGNIMPPVYMYINLTGFEGEKVTVEVIGVSNYGMEYAIMNIRNVNVPGTAQYNIDDDFISFVDYSKASNRKSVDIKDGTTYAVSFTVPQGEQVNVIRANLTNENALNDCSINVSVYSFDGSYASSVATTPLYTKTYTSVIKSADLEVKLGAGNYVMVVKYVAASGSVFSTVMTDNAWSASTLPAEYAKYNIVSYKNGVVDAATTVYGGFLVEILGAVVPVDDVIDATFADTDAKVIVIAGQSNAAGTTKTSYLTGNLSAEEYAKYENGFSNVKIFYTCGSGSTGVSHTNVVEEFVEVKIGQGYLTSTFGPELALAAYLAENYPDEQFYIIKYAIGGTAMDMHWNALDESKRQCLNELEEKMDSGLELLKAEGLDPKIVAFFWMQGEGDANPASRTAPYYNYQKALIGELRERYADYAIDGDIPFIDTEISNDGFWAASYMINDAKNDIAEESGRNYIIDTNYYGLTTRYENNDLAHYDSTSMILLGQLYAKKLCEIYDFSAE